MSQVRGEEKLFTGCLCCGSVPTVAFEIVQMGSRDSQGLTYLKVPQLVRGMEEVLSQICATSALRLLAAHRANSFGERV